MLAHSSSEQLCSVHQDPGLPAEETEAQRTKEVCPGRTAHAGGSRGPAQLWPLLTHPAHLRRLTSVCSLLGTAFVAAFRSIIKWQARAKALSNASPVESYLLVGDR